MLKSRQKQTMHTTANGTSVIVATESLTHMSPFAMLQPAYCVYQLIHVFHINLW